ncbi:unnamed protein product [Auanema sp. JU1783]|nr:unnamed protein product [Auanema sp. JU1783]
MSNEALKLHPGQSIERWAIEKKLGEGAFGAVYQVRDPTGCYALKVESAHAKYQTLKMEVHVLTELSNKNNRHFVRIMDRGRFGAFNFVVMTLVGKSLHDLRKESPSQHFSLPCAIGVGIQTLEAVQDLHEIGYLHRDLKPANYSIGRAENGEIRKIYVLDFGMCRKFISDDGIIRRPRSQAGFRGTARYASLACHLNQDLSRKDDVENWLYMQIEMTIGRVPWKHTNDIGQIGEYKKRCRHPPGINDLFPPNCPQEYRTIMTMLDETDYYGTPPYESIYQILRNILARTGRQEFPYDWER